MAQGEVSDSGAYAEVFFGCAGGGSAHLKSRPGMQMWVSVLLWFSKPCLKSLEIQGRGARGPFTTPGYASEVMRQLSLEQLFYIQNS